jgi:flap endonuclease-1
VGVNLRDLFPQHPLPHGWLDGKRVAVDGHNVAFRYLSSFRGRDGDLLRAPDGRAIGHLLGYANLVRHLRERGAEPIVVWDGPAHERKRRTVDERRRLRRDAGDTVDALEAELQQATLLGLPAFGAAHRASLQAQVGLLEALLPADPGAAGELEERRAEVARAARLTDAQLGAARAVRLEQEVLEARRRFTAIDGRMIADATRLLETLGVAVLRAPHDGERYAAALCGAGHADVVATEDFDALVAGAPAVLRKAGSLQAFLHRLEDLGGHRLTPAQLRHVAILCGTDFHPGVKGFGAKTAARMMQEFPDVRRLIAEAERGEGSTRYHVLLRASGLTLDEFDGLDAFLADVPEVEAPRPARPDPAAAAALAAEMGLHRERVLACFC